MAVLGCHAQAKPADAQTVQAGVRLSPEDGAPGRGHDPQSLAGHARLRHPSASPPRAKFPAMTSITVIFTIDGNASHPLPFLLSTDGKTLAQFNKFDLSKDPEDLISAAGRPARGGPENAPVLIVGFDDLECPFCAKMHAQTLPARCSSATRTRSASSIATSHSTSIPGPCTPRSTPTASARPVPAGYWNFVDYVHAHAVRDCRRRQDHGQGESDARQARPRRGRAPEVEPDRPRGLRPEAGRRPRSRPPSSEAMADPLRVDSTPVLFINGEKVEGALPIETLYEHHRPAP